MIPTFKPPKKQKVSQNSPGEKKKINPPAVITDEELEILKCHAELKCEVCEMIFNTWVEIREHYSQVHRMKGYVRCCGRKIDRTGEMKDHISVS